jgi:hypothetical protein
LDRQQLLELKLQRRHAGREQSGALAKSEIAGGRALHDRLAPGQFEFAVEAETTPWWWGELANCLVNDLMRCFLAEFISQRVNERDERAPFDLAALQVTDSNFDSVNHERSPVGPSLATC